MSSEHTRHHHSHKKMDGATLFKNKSLLSLQRRKTFSKWFYRFLIVLAVVLAAVVVYIYTVG